MTHHEASDSIASVACGEYHSVVMTKDGLVYTFGQNMCGNLGLGHYRDSKHPTLMNIEKFKRKAVVAVKCSTSFTLFLCNDTSQSRSPNEATIAKTIETPDNIESDGIVPKNDDEAGETLQTNTTCGDRNIVRISSHGSDSNGSGVKDNVDDMGSDQKEVEKHFQVWEKKILPQWEHSLKSNTSHMTLLRKYMFLGIPQTLRGRVWKLAIGNRLRVTTNLFKMLRSDHSTSGVQTIIYPSNHPVSSTALDNDLPRTFAKLGLFGEQGAFHEELKEILEVYRKYRPDIGYVQGMSYIAALLCLSPK